MAIFESKNIEAVKGKIAFKQLVILTEDQKQLAALEIEELEGVLDEYEADLEKKDLSAFKRILSVMNLVANQQSVPKEKFRDITPGGENIPEYEFKAGPLRVYAIKIPNGQMVLFGGFKNKQDKDIARFRSLKKRYLSTL